MDLNHPLATATPTLDGDVLALLAQRDGAFTTGQVFRMLGRYSPEGVRKVLVRLTKQGVVLADRIGNAYTYRLNRSHLAAPAIIELANLAGTLFSKIEERLAQWPDPPVYAAVFGSAARGEMSVDSDLDLLLIRADDADVPTWDGEVASLATDVTSWTGNDARTVEYTARGLRAARSEPVLQDVLRDGLTVAGEREWFARQLRGRRR